jgi:catechol 2,3-dioxygenase-like lactoylglutathione lyase family enzyme
MFKDSKAFSGFSVDDVAEAKKFYQDILGLEIGQEMMGMFEVKLGTGGSVMVYPKDDHKPATYTVLNFPVSDIDAAVDELTAKGVEFEKYEGFEQDEKGIARSTDPGHGPSIAWFKDPAGNILSVLS